MKPEIYKFRSAVLGGFNRRDVVQYMEQSAREHQERIKALTEQLEQVRREKEEQEAKLQGLDSLTAQEAKIRASLEESTQSLTALRGELQMTQGKLTLAKKELGDLQKKVEELEPLARQYEALKDRVATVELDAHQKAQATIDQAQARAEEIRRDTARWLTEISGSYMALRETVFTCARQAEETQRAFTERETGYRELLERGGLVPAGEDEA